MERKNLIRFFILAYLLFWVLLAFTGMLMALGVPNVVIEIMKNVCAWAPTFVILMMLKRIAPNTSFWEYLKDAFRGKLKASHLLISFLIQSGVVMLSIFGYMIIENQPLGSLTFQSFIQAVPLFFINLTSGPMGEELGWRTYALNDLQKRHNPLKSSLVLGLLWGMWHLPLWMLSGYTGVSLLLYIGAFMVAIVSFSVIMTFFYNKSQNLLVAIWMHFWFNFLLSLIVAPLEIFLTILIYVSVIYGIVAIIIIFLNRKHFL